MSVFGQTRTLCRVLMGLVFIAVGQSGLHNKKEQLHGRIEGFLKFPSDRKIHMEWTSESGTE